MRITWMGTTFTTYKHMYAALIRRGVVGDAISQQFGGADKIS